MAVATFDTLKFANTLKAAGVPEKQAEAQAVAFAEVIQVNMKDLATKDDLAYLLKEIKQELAEMRKDFRQEMAEFKKDIRQELKDTEQRLTIRIDTAEQKLGNRIDNLDTRTRGDIALLRWMTGAFGFGTIAVLIRVFLFKSPLF